MDNQDDEDLIYVEATPVFCDGGKGALGHPGVYLTIGDSGNASCPYCGRHFALVEAAGIGAGH